MNPLSQLSINELGQILRLVQQSHGIRQHGALFAWLQEDIQKFLPHEILIAAWGNFNDDTYCYDIASPLPGMRTREFDEKTLRPFLLSLFLRWQNGAHAPFVLDLGDNRTDEASNSSDALDATQSWRYALVHGIRDKRSRHDCLYVVLGSDQLSTPRSKAALLFLLPHIDSNFRQIDHLPEHVLAASAEPFPHEPAGTAKTNRHGLSGRELEIINWVSKGKTNQEIGQILGISIFTVKNHLQRIFRKMNVSNRAQLVGKRETGIYE